MEDWEFELEEIKVESKRWRKFIGELCEQHDRKHRLCETYKIVVSCPWCGGVGTDGNDRELPPNPYNCQICGGSGDIEIKPFTGEDNE